jgi:hypothetical protein
LAVFALAVFDFALDLLALPPLRVLVRLGLLFVAVALIVILLIPLGPRLAGPIRMS